MAEARRVADREHVVEIVLEAAGHDVDIGLEAVVGGQAVIGGAAPPAPALRT